MGKLLLFLLFLFVTCFSANAYDLNISDQPLHHVARILAEQSGLNIVVDHEVKDLPVTLYLKGMETPAILDVLSKMHNLTIHHFSENTIALHHASKSRQYGSSQLDFLGLSHVRAKNIIPTLNMAFPGVEFSAAGEHRLIVAGMTAKNEKSIKNLLAELDVASAMVDFTLRIVSAEKLRQKGGGLSLSFVPLPNGQTRIEAGLRLNDSRTSTEETTQFRGRLLSGMPFSLFSGKTIPVVSTFTSASAEVHYEPVGNGLQLLLESATEKEILVAVSVDLSILLSNIGFYSAPIIGTRNISTVVSLAPRSSVVIGGLDSGNRVFAAGSSLHMPGNGGSNGTQVFENSRMLLILTANLVE